jgi:hemolysin activation/secretion protein
LTFIDLQNMLTRPFHTFWPLPIALSLSVSSWAQTSPDAGSLRQQIEQQRTLPLPAARPQSTPLPPEIKPTEGTTITVKAFRLVGNTLLSSEQLAPALAPFVGQALDFAGLQRTADTVAAAYREAGWIVRAYLPEQDISEGTLTLQVIEAKFAGLRSEGEPSKRVMREQLQAFFTGQQSQGQALNAHALDRALLLADDLPGISVAGTLVPGAADAETALVLQTTDEPFFFGDLGVDNTGARATGSNRLTANLNINSPSGRGELLSLSGLHTQGSNYGRLALTVPVGHDGWRAGINASAMNYEVINGPSANTDSPIKGRSGTMGLDLSYPLLRARLSNLYLLGGIENKSFFNRDSTVTADYESNSLRMGLSGNRFDNLWGGGANSGSLQLHWGRLASMKAHRQIKDIDRSYHKLSYSLSRQQNMTTDHSLLLSLQGQHASQMLDSSEKFYIGGANSVRAYPASEQGGDRGHVLTAEWRWRLDASLVLTAFADTGRVVTLPTDSLAQQTVNLSGRGLSLNWQGPAGISTRLTWARRNGNNPKPLNDNGIVSDGDGTLKRDRIWFTASVPF